MAVFIFLHRFVADEFQRRSDAWLLGEIQVLADLAEWTPKDSLYDRVLGEVAETVSKEIPNTMESERSSNDSVFFTQIGEDGSPKLWVGAGTGQETLRAVAHSRMVPDLPRDVRVDGSSIPYRVVSTRIKDGSRIYLGLSERYERRTLHTLTIRFSLLWMVIVLSGFAMVFTTTRRMLSHVQKITESASRIGQFNLHSRVPTTDRQDEAAHLAVTLNRMLDRIESSMNQLHTITDSLAHDLRSPLTAIRGKLEMSLTTASPGEQTGEVVSAIEELDRLTDFLCQSLDISEAKADALQLSRSEIDLSELLSVMVDVYGPTLAGKGLKIKLHNAGPVKIEGDAGLIHRMIGNLLDNSLKHLLPACTETIRLQADDESAFLIFEDDGPGFAPEVKHDLFERRVKGSKSNGHGLGLAFVGAVVRAHGGTAKASNRESGGARITIALPLVSNWRTDPSVQPIHDSTMVPC
jgi:signal transduction histidine kinase